MVLPRILQLTVSLITEVLLGLSFIVLWPCPFFLRVESWICHCFLLSLLVAVSVGSFVCVRCSKTKHIYKCGML